MIIKRFNSIGHMPKGSRAAGALKDPLLERAIGVIYRPETERQSHYFHASLSRQFNAVIHIDTTPPSAARAVSRMGIGQAMETFSVRRLAVHCGSRSGRLKT